MENKSKSGFEEARASLIKETKGRLKHSFTRDLLIIQLVSHVMELEKICNMMVTRLREWFELYNPEFSHSIRDNKTFVNELFRDVQKSEMGAELDKTDIEPLIALASQLSKIYDLKELQENNLDKLMTEETPNLTAVAGPLIGARLISLAGSIKKLSSMTSSTVQLLGAERALFRHLKNKKQKLPKAGILYDHPLLANAPREAKGKLARTLASKISIAVKVDFFKGEFIGDKLKKELDSKNKR